jgi:DNA-binding FrmR family transcriptional regulator
VLESWTADGRTVITATRSGNERNATRFAEHFTAALSSDEADLDKNGLVSAQEAFDFAARKVADSYEAEGMLATEHPQIAGDGAQRFTVARLSARPTETPELEALSSRMAEIEGELEALRQRRDQMESDAYLNELQALLLQLATVQQEIDRAQANLESTED